MQPQRIDRSCDLRGWCLARMSRRNCAPVNNASSPVGPGPGRRVQGLGDRAAADAHRGSGSVGRAHKSSARIAAAAGPPAGWSVRLPSAGVGRSCTTPRADTQKGAGQSWARWKP
jgi:hypothetical protein